MSLPLDLSDLTRLDRIRGVLAERDARGQFGTLGIDQLVIDEDALADLAGVVERQLIRAGRPAGPRTRIDVLADPVLIRRDGQDLKAMVASGLAARFDVRRVTLDDGHPALHADEAVLDRAAAAAAGADCIVSVGGGTITDIGKIAAMRASVPVHVVVQTAASVDGFTDNVSVVLQNGVKRTIPSRWPDAVLTDCRTLAEAPHTLNAAGLGELLSMYSAPGDWLLAERVGMDDTFSPVLIELLALCGEGVADWAAEIGRRSVAGIRRLASALAMRGIVTGVGGTSASLSGMEHLISHMLDIHRAERGEATGLHGAQVGVASVIAAAAWEVFCERMDETPLDPARLFDGGVAWEDRVKTAFGTLDPSGRVGAECWKHYRQKLAKWHDNRATVATFFEHWRENRERRRAVILGPATIAACLHRARAPMRAGDLEPAPTPDLLRWAVAHCQFMRERFTIADLLTFAGWWDDSGVARVFDRVEAACAAAEAHAS
jgi:glycerol-1-phosphate dehydrogenase [NAD(P)+]